LITLVFREEKRAQIFCVNNNVVFASATRTLID